MLVCFSPPKLLTSDSDKVFLTAHGSLVAKHHFINSSSLILHGTFNVHLSRVMRKPTFCICENEGADQLRG